MGSDTNGIKSVLYWPDAFQQRRTLTIPHGRRDNVSTFRLAEGYDKFQAFCTEIGESLDSDDEPLALPLEVVSDKDDDDYDDGDNSGETSSDADLRGRIIGPSPISQQRRKTM